MKPNNFTGGNLGSTHNNRVFESNTPSRSPQVSTAIKRNNFYNHVPSMIKVISKVRAYFIVRGVKSALKEVDLIEKGIKKPKSLDQLLNEL